MRFLNMVIADTIANPYANATTMTRMKIVHPPILRLTPHIVEDHINAVTAFLKGFHESIWADKSKFPSTSSFPIFETKDGFSMYDYL